MTELVFSLSPWQWWLVASAGLFILEIFTPGFVLACFGAGALVAFPFALLGLGLVWQITFFAISSLLSLFFLRPLMVRLSANKKHLAIGADALIGRVVLVTHRVEPLREKGRVAVDGDSWRATTIDGTDIETDTAVRIMSRESLILVVEKVEQDKQ